MEELITQRKVNHDDQCLLHRDPDTQTLKVNFGRDTLAILNEVKHLSKDFPKREVPDKAKEVFRRFDDLRNYNNSLEQVERIVSKRMKTI